MSGAEEDSSADDSSFAFNPILVVIFIFWKFLNWSHGARCQKLSCNIKWHIGCLIR